MGPLEVSDAQRLAYFYQMLANLGEWEGELSESEDPLKEAAAFCWVWPPIQRLESREEVRMMRELVDEHRTQHGRCLPHERRRIKCRVICSRIIPHSSWPKVARIEHNLN